ncbi:MlaD family protein [Pseudonocardia alni]|uniref:MlaD family protein n=1 Tax=Pseudonocardia alni TaxID=33907 RepID=UPI0033CB4371
MRTAEKKPSRLGGLFARARSEPGLLRNLAVLAGLMVLGVAVGGILLSQQRVTWPWEDKLVFSATFDQTPGISPGNGQEVRIAGVSVGQITDATVDDQGRGVVEMEIDGDQTVYDNARLVLRPKSPLNEMFVNISPGGPPGREITGGEVLPSSNTERPVQIEEVLGHLDGNTREALGSLLSEADVALASAPAELPRGLTAADGVLQKLQPVVSELNARRDTLAKLTSALSTVSTSVGADDTRLAGLADSLQKTLRSVGAQQDNLDQALGQLPGVSTSLREATGEVQGLSDQLDPTLDNVRSASDVLPGALDRLNGSVEQLDTTLDSARPFLASARPVVGDLRPFVEDANVALNDLRPSTERLDPITDQLLPYLTDLQAFIYNTNDVTSLSDANRGIFRGQTQLAPTSLPLPLQQVAGQPGR